MTNSFGAKDTLTVGDKQYEIYRIDSIPGSDRLPYSMKILLENLLRNEDGASVTADQVRALAAWNAADVGHSEIQFTPARVLLQDFTGVPCVVDLVAMRDAMDELGGDPQQVTPLIPVELVIDHSVIADSFGRPQSAKINADLEFERNRERYQLLRWAQHAFDDFVVVPPDTGICHQVNLEYLARVVFGADAAGDPMPQAYPDTLVGTDSHTPMVNGLGVLGWGVGGIEAEAAMLGQPLSMLVPQVAPYSGAILPMVARSASGRCFRPSPKNSTNLPTTPSLRSIWVTVSTRSVAVAPSLSLPVSLKPTTSGITIGCGWPSIDASASMPPTPQPSTARPFTIVVWLSVPTSVSG